MPTFNITAPDGTMYRVAAPEGATEQDALARVQEQHVASPPQTANGRIADDFASLPRSPGSLMDTREVPRPGAPGGNYSSDITQRARNTAFGQGPGTNRAGGPDRGSPTGGVTAPRGVAPAAPRKARPAAASACFVSLMLTFLM